MRYSSRSPLIDGRQKSSSIPPDTARRFCGTRTGLTVAAADVADRAAAELTCRRAVRGVKLYCAGLQTVGTDNAISTGPYEPCGLWSDALWSHSNSPDGIAYQSRHDSNELSTALFQRPDMKFEIKATRPLMAMLHEIAALLDRYGKALSPS